MKLNATLALSAAALLAACGGGSSGTNNEPTVQVGQQIQSGTLELTVDRIYNNGAAVLYFDNVNGGGQTYRSNPADASNDPGSTIVSEETFGTRIHQSVSAIGEGFNREGTRDRLILPNNAGAAQSQIRQDVSGPNMDLAAFGSPLTNIPTGTVTYGGGADDAAFINMNGAKVQLPFTFTANLSAGTATLTANNGTHRIDAQSIAIDATNGRFYGTSAQVGAVGSLLDANVSGALFGTDGMGVGGIVYSTDQAAPSISANFVGSR